MKLDYFTLLSPSPVYLNGIGSIKSPTLNEISKLTYNLYQYYISVLLLDIDSYYKNLEKNDYSYLNNFSDEERIIILKIKNEYDFLEKDKKKQFSFYNILVFDKHIINTLINAFNFFFEDEVIYNENERVFLLMNGLKNDSNENVVTGIIHEGNYELVIDLILQRINIEKPKDEIKNGKPKNKIAEKIMKKIESAAKIQKKKEDKKLELGNIISSVASHSKSLNIVNIWDATVFQIYDQFTRNRLDDSYSMNSRSVSVWGDKDKKFNDTLWFSTIHENQ